MVIREFLTLLGFKVENKGFDKYKKVMGGVIKYASLAATATLGVGAAMLKEAADMEQVEVAFETMTGSMETAQSLIKDITDFAAKTPFELKGLVENSKKLLAFGFEAENIVDTMKDLGNIAAGVGKDKLNTIVRSLGKIKTKGRATMEELNMMLEAGVPILDQLAANLGVTSQELFKMISAGKISFTDVNNALHSMANEGGKFNNLMIKQSKTMGGLWSNIKDWIQQMSISIGKELLPMAKEIAKSFLNWANANKKMIKTKAVDIIKKLTKVIRFLVTDLPKMLKTLKKILTILSPLIAATYSYILATKLIVLWEKRAAIARLLGAKAQAALNLIMSLNPVALIIAGIAALIAIIVLMVKHWDKVKAALSKVWEWFMKILDNKWIAILGAIFMPFITVPALIIKHWGVLKEFFAGLWDGIIGVFKSAWDFIGGIIDKVANAVKKVVGAVKGLATKVGGKIKGTWNKWFGPDEENPANAMTGSPKSKNTNNKNVNVQSSVSVQVPPGTPKEQQEFINNEVKKTVKEEIDNMSNSILANA